MRRLSPREQDVALLVAAGAHDLVIAVSLDLSPRTVKNYILRVQRRLDLRSRDEVAAWVAARLPSDASSGRLRRIEDVRSLK